MAINSINLLNRRTIDDYVIYVTVTKRNESGQHIIQTNNAGKKLEDVQFGSLTKEISPHAYWGEDFYLDVGYAISFKWCYRDELKGIYTQCMSNLSYYKYLQIDYNASNYYSKGI